MSGWLSWLSLGYSFSLICQFFYKKHSSRFISLCLFSLPQTRKLFPTHWLCKNANKGSLCEQFRIAWKCKLAFNLEPQIAKLKRTLFWASACLLAPPKVIPAWTFCRVTFKTSHVWSGLSLSTSKISPVIFPSCCHPFPRKLLEIILC